MSTTRRGWSPKETATDVRTASHEHGLRLVLSAVLLVACSSSDGTAAAKNTDGGSLSSGGASNGGGSGGQGGVAGARAGSGGAAGANAGGAGGGVSPGKATVEFGMIGSYCATIRSCASGPSVDVEDSPGHSLFGVQFSCSSVSCATCTMSPCPGFFCPPETMPVAVTGGTLEWDGGYYAMSTCGGGTSCVERRFVTPGKYTARFCATPGNVTSVDGGPVQCFTTGPEKCGSVEFDFPSSTVIEGTVGP